VPWLPSPTEIRATVGGGLIGTYSLSGEAVRFEGPRPGPGWHRNDWRPRKLLVLRPTGPERLLVYRRRWRLAGTTRTHQDRCPDEVGALHVVAVVLCLKLWSWLSGTRGLHHYDEVVPALRKYGCERTVQRWLARMLPHALAFEHAVIEAVIERSEPRPVEQLFPGGLSPPDTLLRRQWLDPARTSTLWQGLAWLLGGAIKLGMSTTALLAEVRRRTPHLTFTS